MFTLLDLTLHCRPPDDAVKSCLVLMLSGKSKKVPWRGRKTGKVRVFTESKRKICMFVSSSVMFSVWFIVHLLVYTSSFTHQKRLYIAAVGNVIDLCDSTTATATGQSDFQHLLVLLCATLSYYSPCFHPYLSRLPLAMRPALLTARRAQRCHRTCHRVTHDVNRRVTGANCAQFSHFFVRRCHVHAIVPVIVWPMTSIVVWPAWTVNSSVTSLLDVATCMR